METKNIFWTVKDENGIRPMAKIDRDDTYGEEAVRDFAKKKGMTAVRVEIKEI